MSATYDPTLAAPLDQVRFRLGDTSVTPASNALLSDEEIAALLAANGGSVGKAAVAGCRGLIARFARLVTHSVGDTSDQFSDLVDHYRDLLKGLQRELAASGSALPFAGGISVADKTTRDANPDRTTAAFTRDGIGSTGNRFSTREDER